MSDTLKSIRRQYFNLTKAYAPASAICLAIVCSYKLFGFSPSDHYEIGSIVDRIFSAVGESLSVSNLIRTVLFSAIATFILKALEPKIRHLKGLWLRTAQIGFGAVYSALACAGASLIGLYAMGLTPELSTRADLAPYLALFGANSLIVPMLAGLWLASPPKAGRQEEPRPEAFQ